MSYKYAFFFKCFVGVCFGSTLTYVELVGGATPLIQIKDIGLHNFQQVLNNYSLLELFTGDIAGAMGETSKVLILAGAIYLFVRKSADIRTFLSCLITYILLSVVAGIVIKVDVVKFTLFQLLTGGVLFGAVYMITDPVTTPITGRGRILFDVVGQWG